MDVKGIKTQLADMLGTLAIVDSIPARFVRANAQAPMSLAETDLPTWNVFTGPASYPDPPDRSDDRLAHETRDFYACLYVCRSQAGISGEAERRVEPYLDSARNLIQSHALLARDRLASVVPGILRAYLLRDDGITQLKFGVEPVNFDGLRFTIRVVGLNSNAYGDE